MEKIYYSRSDLTIFAELETKKVVGRVVLILDFDSDPSVSEIWSLYVEPEYRNQGIATCLLKLCEAFAIAENKDTIELGVSSNNNAAICLYKKLGYFPKAPNCVGWMSKNLKF